MLSGAKDVQNITNRLFLKTLGKKDRNFYVLDEFKLTLENLEKLSKSVENSVSQAPLVSGIISQQNKKVALR